MSGGWKTAVWILVALLAGLAALVAALLVWALPQIVGSITVNGQTIELTQAHAGHWLMATAVVLVAMMVVMLVVPVALVLGLALPIFATAFAMLVVAAVLALVLSPLLLVGWLIWRSSRRPAANTATIHSP